MCATSFLDFCESTEGCFAAPTCTEEYLLNKADVSSEEFSLVETVASSSPTASVSSNHPTILLSADVSMMCLCELLPKLAILADFHIYLLFYSRRRVH
jgi:hypothetical protein